MSAALWALADNGFLDTCGRVFLHFLWEGVAVMFVFAIALRVLAPERPVHRYGILWAALLAMGACPLVTAFVVVSKSGPAGDGIPLVNALGVCWGVGSLVMGLRLLANLMGAELTRVVCARPVESKWSDRVGRLAALIGLNGHVHLVESRFVDRPGTVGWLRPVIVLPPSALYGLKERELEAVLAHELAHIRRRDFAVNVAQSAIEALLFFHPAVWWVSRSIRAERECCCDELAADACGDRKLYARSLCHLEIARLVDAKLAMSATEGVLKRRIERLTGSVATKARAVLDQPALLSAGLLVTLGLFGVSLAIVDDGRGGQPEVARHLEVQQLVYAPPHDISLPAYGRVCFRSHIRGRECHQEFTVWPECRGTVAIQIIPVTEGFQPFLATRWPCLYEPDHNDGDLGSGRGCRPFHRVVLNYGEPRNWIRFQVCCRHEGESPRMPTKDPNEEAEYIAVIWQPRVHNDIDPNLIGPGASPVLLEGHEWLNPPSKENPPTAMDFAQDVDVFHVEGTAESVLRITVDGTSGGLDPYLRVYDKAGQLLAEAAAKQAHVAWSTVDCRGANERFYFAVTAQNGKDLGEYSVRVGEILKVRGARF